MTRAAERGVLPGEPGRLVVPKLHCRGCGKPVPKGRRNWCGDACVADHLLRNNPRVARAKTFERDCGVCSACGRKTTELELKIGRWLAGDWLATKELHYIRIEHQGGELFRVAQRRRKFAARFKIRLMYHWAQQPMVDGQQRPFFKIWTLWEMDHATPVVEGGGGCGLDNLRTLCRCCHKKASAALAARRAAERRKA